MDYSDLRLLRQTHPGWMLLRADHAPLVMSFLYQNFVEPNVRSFKEQELVSRLDDFLFSLREQEGAESFPKSAAAYLQDWAAHEKGWLRKYYPQNSDEPHYDITPATEKALQWLSFLRERRFVGAESRLLTVFELLQQIVRGSETDPKVRIAELEARKAALDAEIADIREGRMTVLDDTRLRERFVQAADTAFSLLADFRQVEQNFRDLDRQVREKVATWEGSKGEVLQEVFGERDVIAESDQGRSFRAFWDFLMSTARQEELTALLQRVFELEPVQALQPDTRLLRVHYDWLEAGDATQRTVARLSEQLRSYLDNQAWLENRRIMTIIRNIEQHAIALRNASVDIESSIDDTSLQIELPMERPLYSIPQKPSIQQQHLSQGQENIDAEALFNQVYIDKAKLQSRVRRALQTRAPITLGDLLEQHPLEQGLAELVAYLSIAAEDAHATMDDAHLQTVVWTDDEGQDKKAQIPTVIFSRPTGVGKHDGR